MYILSNSNNRLCNYQRLICTFCKFFFVSIISFYCQTIQVCLFLTQSLHILLKLELKILDAFININTMIGLIIDINILIEFSISSR